MAVRVANGSAPQAGGRRSTLGRSTQEAGMASDQWYVGRDGRRLGPYRYAVMRALALSGRLRPSDLVWTAGMTDWQPASAFSGLMSGATGEAGSATERWGWTTVQLEMPQEVRERFGFLGRLAADHYH